MDAHFEIDGAQRVVGWGRGAAALLGIGSATAIGAPCHQVVRGTDPFGRPICRPGCAALRPLQAGGLAGAASILVKGPAGPAALRCSLVALPGRQGGALATLSLRDRALSSPLDGAAAGGDATAHDMAALGALSATLSPQPLEQSVERTLEWLRRETGAEAAELFLAEPRGGDLLLAGFSGPFRTAFYQMTRFPAGQGFPGLVLAQGEPILTTELPSDARYLRTRVKELGFRSYVCVPVRGPGGLLGVLNVAARTPDLDLDRALRMASWAGLPLGAVLEASHLRARLGAAAQARTPTGDGPDGLEGLCRSLLRRMMDVGAASGGALSLLAAGGAGLLLRVEEGDAAGLACPAPNLPGTGLCPAVEHGHGMALRGPRSGWPSPCQHVSARGSVVQCVPMVADGVPVGISQLRYPGAGPLPPTRFLSTLLEMGEQAAIALYQALEGLRPFARPAAGGGNGRSPGGDVAARAGHRSAPGRALPTAGPEAEEPVLDIRCLGTFQLYCRGRLVTPDLLPRRGALSLLKVLAVNGGRPVPREALAEALWPESDPLLAANRFHVLAHALRRLVGKASGGHGDGFLLRDGSSYYLDTRGPCRIDVLGFNRAVAEAEARERQGDLPAAAACYETATHLYRGDLLEDDPYAEWCWEEREALRERYLSAMERLAAICLEGGGVHRAMELYRRGLATDPLRERLHVGLVRALWLAGSPAEALRQYAACRDLLRRELDAAPGPEMERLARQVREPQGA